MKPKLYEEHGLRDLLLPFKFHTVRSPKGLYPTHWHEELEIICCLRGQGTVYCNEESHELKAGDLHIINSNSIHFVSEPAGMDFSFLIIDSHFCHENGISIEHLYFQPLIRDSAMTEAFLAVSRAYDDHMHDPRLASPIAMRAYVLTFLSMLCDRYLERAGDPAISGTEARIRSAMLYIRQNFQKSITLEDIARHAGISKYYLTRAFKSHTGKTVFDFLVQTRCVEARSLIKEGVSVSDAARSCGFESISYFSRIFKRYYQVPPSHYLPKSNSKSP